MATSSVILTQTKAKPIYVGLCGGLGVGKTTFARLLSFELKDYKCRIAAFGNILKSFVSVVYGIPVGLLHKESGKNSLPNWVSLKRPLKHEEVPPIMLNAKGFKFFGAPHIDVMALDKEIVEGCVACPMGMLTCGKLLQIVGEAFRCRANQDFWVNQLQAFLNSVKTSEFDVVIVEDVRYENEARWILSKGGGIIKLAGAPPTKSSIANRDLDHPSEQGFSASIFATVYLGDRHDSDFYAGAKEIALKLGSVIQ